MTEGDRAFYKRRLREEIKQARMANCPQLRQLHLRWAVLYQERLDGTPKSVTSALETRLRNAGFSAEQIAVPCERMSNRA
jgi:hypothetical protein